MSLALFPDDPPPRPPLPAEVGGASSSYGRGYAGADTTDDESEEIFHKAPTPSQGPIMVSWKNNLGRAIKISNRNGTGQKKVNY